MGSESAIKGSLSVGASSSSAPSSSCKSINKSDSVLRRGSSFKQFDIVDDYSDHHFANNAKDVQNIKNDWVKKVQQEWKVLETNLPETIFVRAYEQRIDLLRAVMIGPAGTPYHDGLFFFDFHFPSHYPHVPPKAYYHSFGVRLNPNLYANGTVCLSLLDTWHGRGCEKWKPKTSTMLQILVSIQALVLNAKPYFNEPAYKGKANTRQGKKASSAYSESAFLLSCHTMIYVLRKPLKNFEDFTAEHFREHGYTILAACKAYMRGVEIGCALEEEGKLAVESVKGQAENFMTNLKKYFEVLLSEFRGIGVDCEEFRAQTVRGKEVLEQKTNADDASTSTSHKPAKPKSLLKRVTQFLLKLGKKVLPVEK